MYVLICTPHTLSVCPNLYSLASGGTLILRAHHPPLFSLGHPTAATHLVLFFFSSSLLLFFSSSLLLFFSSSNTPYGFSGPPFLFFSPFPSFMGHPTGWLGLSSSFLSFLSFPSLGHPTGWPGLFLLLPFSLLFPWDTLRVSRASSPFFLSFFLSSLSLECPTGSAGLSSSHLSFFSFLFSLFSFIFPWDTCRVGWGLILIFFLSSLFKTPAGLTNFFPTISSPFFPFSLTLVSLPLELLHTAG